MDFFTFAFYDKLSDFTLFSSIALLFLYLFLKHKDKIIDFSVALLIAITVSKVAKYLTNFPRPEGILVFDDASFPSMHTAMAFTTFFFFINVCHRLRYGKDCYFKDFRKPMDIAFLIVLFILNFFTAIFRITSTAHSLIDVIAGIILGLIISLVFVYYDVSVKRER